MTESPACGLPQRTSLATVENRTLAPIGLWADSAELLHSNKPPFGYYDGVEKMVLKAQRHAVNLPNIALHMCTLFSDYLIITSRSDILENYYTQGGS